MSWPTDTIDLSHVDNAGDDVTGGRLTAQQMVLRTKDVLAGGNTASGIALLSSAGQVASAHVGVVSIGRGGLNTTVFGNKTMAYATAGGFAFTSAGVSGAYLKKQNSPPYLVWSDEPFFVSADTTRHGVVRIGTTAEISGFNTGTKVMGVGHVYGHPFVAKAFAVFGMVIDGGIHNTGTSVDGMGMKYGWNCSVEVETLFHSALNGRTAKVSVAPGARPFASDFLFSVKFDFKWPDTDWVYYVGIEACNNDDDDNATPVEGRVTFISAQKLSAPGRNVITQQTRSTLKDAVFLCDDFGNEYFIWRLFFVAFDGAES